MGPRRSRAYEPLQPEIKEFTLSEIDRGIAKLKRRIQDVSALDPTRVAYNDAVVQTVESNMRLSIQEVFGPRSPESFEHGCHRIYRDAVGHVPFQPGPEYFQRNFAAGIPQTLTMLQGLIARLEEKRGDELPDDRASSAGRAAPSGGRRVFVVHGQDGELREATARFLEKLELAAVVLREQPQQGRTLIEKIEANADVTYAVVLLTPDDLGHRTGEPGEAQVRARQNVIFELGYFVGRIGRGRVCLLYKSGVEMPSDLHGVGYVDLDDPTGWRLLLARELKAAGIEVDLDKAV